MMAKNGQDSMTVEMEVLSQEPGRELDVLVAEKVTGLQHVRLRPGWTDQAEGGFIFLKSGGESEWGYEVAGRIYAVPHYSTHIEDAWRVVEHLDVGLELERWKDAQGRLWYSAEFSSAGDGADAGTASHAICLAALKTVD